MKAASYVLVVVAHAKTFNDCTGPNSVGASLCFLAVPAIYPCDRFFKLEGAEKTVVPTLLLLALVSLFILPDQF